MGYRELSYFSNGDIKYKMYEYPRYDGPVVVDFHVNGMISNCEWMIEGGKRHREDGPAQVIYDLTGNLAGEFWHINGERHREDGPAGIYYDGKPDHTFWCLSGEICLDVDEYYAIMELGRSIVSRNHAIMYIKHEKRYIRRKCRGILGVEV